ELGIEAGNRDRAGVPVAAHTGRAALAPGGLHALHSLAALLDAPLAAPIAPQLLVARLDEHGEGERGVGGDGQVDGVEALEVARPAMLQEVPQVDVDDFGIRLDVLREDAAVLDATGLAEG